MRHSSFFRDFKSSIATGWEEMKPMIFSHHPTCDRFQNHTINIGKVRFCIGCFVGYPSGIISFLLFYFLFSFQESHALWYFLIGVLLFSMVFLSLTSLTEIRWVKILQKLAIGTGNGVLLASTLHYLDKFEPWMRLLILWLMVIGLMIPIGFLHYRSMTHTCKDCDQKNQNSTCLFKWFVKSTFSFYLNNPKIIETTELSYLIITFFAAFLQ